MKLLLRGILLLTCGRSAVYGVAVLNYLHSSVQSRASYVWDSMYFLRSAAISLRAGLPASEVHKLSMPLAAVPAAQGDSFGIFLYCAAEEVVDINAVD